VNHQFRYEKWTAIIIRRVQNFRNINILCDWELFSLFVLLSNQTLSSTPCNKWAKMLVNEHGTCKTKRLWHVHNIRVKVFTSRDWIKPQNFQNTHAPGLDLNPRICRTGRSLANHSRCSVLSEIVSRERTILTILPRGLSAFTSRRVASPGVLAPSVPSEEES
jgi:hypothetical protein